MGKLIVGASGIGKTYFVKHTLNWIDLDSFVFNNFIHSKMSVKKIIDLLDWYDYNIITTSRTLVSYPELKEYVKYVVIPSYKMKYEILDRVILRDQKSKEGVEWYHFYKTNWEFLIKEFEKLPFPKIYLQPGQYLSDVIDENGDAKPGVEVVE